MQHSHEDERAKIVGDFDRAAQSLLKAEEEFSSLTKVQEGKLRSMRSYLSNLSKMITTVSGIPDGKKRRSMTAKTVANSAPYKHCTRIISNYQQFLNEESQRLSVKLQSANDPLTERISNLPVNDTSITKLNWMSAQYRKAVPAITEKQKKNVEKFAERSAKLPVSYEEYRTKASDFYEAVLESIVDQDRAQIIKTFPTLAPYVPRHGLRIVSRNSPEQK